MNPNCNMGTAEGDCFTPSPSPVVIHPGHGPIYDFGHYPALPDTGSQITPGIELGIWLVVIGIALLVALAVYGAIREGAREDEHRRTKGPQTGAEGRGEVHPPREGADTIDRTDDEEGTTGKRTLHRDDSRETEKGSDRQ